MQDGNGMRWFCPYLCPKEKGEASTSGQSIVHHGTIYPCPMRSPAPALYTYYAMMSLMVVVLAITLIWIPFVQLIAELNSIISKALLYVNKELLGEPQWCGLSKLGEFFNSPQGLAVILFICLSYLFYVASTDFLIFAGCYLHSLPNCKWIQYLKTAALNIIVYLLNITGHEEIEFQRKFNSYSTNRLARDPVKKY